MVEIVYKRAHHVLSPLIRWEVNVKATGLMIYVEKKLLLCS